MQNIIDKIQTFYLTKTYNNPGVILDSSPVGFFREYYRSIHQYLSNNFNESYVAYNKILKMAKESGLERNDPKVKKQISKCYNVETFLKEKKGSSKEFAELFAICANTNVQVGARTYNSPYIIGIYKGLLKYEENGVKKSIIHYVPYIKTENKKIPEIFLIDSLMGSKFRNNIECYCMSTPVQYKKDIYDHKKAMFVVKSSIEFDKNLKAKEMLEVLNKKQQTKTNEEKNLTH